MIYQRVQEEDELSYTVWSLVMVREPVTSARAEVLPARSALTLEKSRNNSPILVFSRNILSRSTVAITGTSVRTGKTRRPWWRQSRGLETARRQRDRGFSSAAKKKKLIFRGGDPRLRTNPLFISPRGNAPLSRVLGDPRLVTTLPRSACPFAPTSLPSSLPVLLAPSPPVLVSFLAYLSITVFRDSQFTRVGRKKKKETGGTYRLPLLFSSPLKRVSRVRA